jgi:hypothetical protein
VQKDDQFSMLQALNQTLNMEVENVKEEKASRFKKKYDHSKEEWAKKDEE